MNMNMIIEYDINIDNEYNNEYWKMNMKIE